MLHFNFCKVQILQYAMLVSTRKEEAVYCVQKTKSNLHLVMPQNVIVLVMKNLILLMISTLNVVRLL